MKNIKILKESIELLGLKVSEKQLNQFQNYYNLLIDWNNKINLTSITDWDEVVIKHFIDSLMAIKIYDLNTIDNLIDVGTGAGFPSIPIKIMFPKIHMTLLDALNKRIDFLKIVCENLELDNMRLVHGRAEEYGKDFNYREKYDICISRAVSQLSILSEYCLPFIKINGVFIAYKSLDSDQEIKKSKEAINILGCKIDNIFVKDVPLSDFKRKYVIVKKYELTSIKYPRRFNKISKKPL